MTARTDVTPDNILEALIGERRSANTQRAYRADVTDFFKERFATDPTPDSIQNFLRSGKERIAFSLSVYKNDLRARGLAEATINRRVSAIRSLIHLAHAAGLTSFDPSGIVPGERVATYKNTSGLTVEQARQLLACPDRETMRGKRDYAMLLLLLENALRSAELRALTVGDFLAGERTILLRAKGKAEKKEAIRVTNHAAEAISDYLEASGYADQLSSALFQNDLSASRRSALTGDGLYKIVRGYAIEIGIQNVISPHRLRNTAITQALAATNGNIAEVQRLSRHALSEAVVKYNANREEEQGRLTELLGTLFQPAEEPVQAIVIQQSPKTTRSQVS